MAHVTPIVQILNNQTTPVMAFMVIGTVLFLSLCLTGLIVRHSGQKLQNVYSGLHPSIGATLMAGFVLFVALITDSAMHNSALAKQSVDKEAHVLNLALSVLEKTQYPEWHAAIGDYIDKVTRDEWSDMGKAIRSHAAHGTLNNLRLLADSGLPGLSPMLRKELRESVNGIDAARQTRLLAAAEDIPVAIWVSLWMTVVLSIAFSAAIHAHQPLSAYLMACFLGLAIGAMFFAIISVDHPFMGPSAISSEPIRTLMATPTGE